MGADVKGVSISERDGLARSVQVRLNRHAKEIGADPNRPKV